MSIFQRGQPLGASEQRYKIRITTVDGKTLFWHKRGELHTVSEDVATIFVANFKPALFQVAADGSLTPPAPGSTEIARVEKVPV